jgi:hypothetical protein
MNDRRAAETVGLNPETAAYTKSKPRVRAYMTEHRDALREKLVDQEAEGLRKLNLGRDQILARLWDLATLSHEVTRGTIAGQIKALSMIVAIEGLIPDRRYPPTGTQPPPPKTGGVAEVEKKVEFYRILQNIPLTSRGTGCRYQVAGACSTRHDVLVLRPLTTVHPTENERPKALWAGLWRHDEGSSNP